MELYEAIDGEDPFDTFITGIEKSVGCEIFTWKILEQNKEGLLSVIVFEDKRVLYGYVKADSDMFKESIGLRIQANFI